MLYVNDVCMPRLFQALFRSNSVIQHNERARFRPKARAAATSARRLQSPCHTGCAQGLQIGLGRAPAPVAQRFTSKTSDVRRTSETADIKLLLVVVLFRCQLPP